VFRYKAAEKGKRKDQLRLHKKGREAGRLFIICNSQAVKELCAVFIDRNSAVGDSLQPVHATTSAAFSPSEPVQSL
jgi:hypothetical protein